MSRSIFGWSLPPGVTMSMIDPPDEPCEVCGEFSDDCICPECPICGYHGDPACYPAHGLHRTDEQKWNFACRQQQWEMDNFAENEYWLEMERKYGPEGDSIINEEI